MASSKLILSKTDQLNLAVTLHRSDLFGIKEDPDEYIKLKSERRSPHYLDIRPAIASYTTRQIIAHSMLKLADTRVVHQGFDYLHQAYDFFAGTPEAMTSYAASIADLAHMGLLQPRVDVNKATGNKTPILGRYQEGARVAEFDDVVTDGASKISTIKGLGQAGLIVADYFVVLDREEGGAAQVQQETGLQITPALGVSSLTLILHAEGLINRTQLDNVAEYLEQYGDAHAQETMRTAA